MNPRMRPVRPFPRTALQPACNGARRGSGTNPLAVPNLTALWERRDVVLSGNEVTQWNDRSGNGYHITPTDAGKRGVINGPAVDLKGCTHLIAGSGIAGLNTRSMTVMWIGNDFAAQNPASGTLIANGTLFYINSIPHGINFGNPYGAREGALATGYGPGLQLRANGGPSVHAVSYSAAGINYLINGTSFAAPALGNFTGTLTHVFGYANLTGPMFQPTRALMIFNRALSTAEMKAIAAYYAAPTAAPARVIYCLGTSTVNAQKTPTYAQGALQMFAAESDSGRCFLGIGGSSWKSMVDSLTANSTRIPSGPRNVTVLIPQTNDFASNVSEADMLTSMTNLINRIVAADPSHDFIWCPIPPRNGSFSGITYDDYDTRRQSFNASMAAKLTGYFTNPRPIIKADYDTIPGFLGKGDEANLANYDADRIHWNTNGHVTVKDSLIRALALIL